MTETPLVIPDVILAVCREIGDRLRELLETKHIYQRIDLAVPEIVERMVSASYVRRDAIVAGILKDLEKDSLYPSDQQLYTSQKGSNGPYPTPVLLLHNLKLFCGACDAAETYAPLYYGEIMNELLKPSSYRRPFDSALALKTRIYHLTYQCQRCMGEPEVFVVRRRGWQMSLEGRSPMEQVSVPPFIPKPERSLFRDSLIASHGGKTLAALFYLRTFIEAFARRVTSKQGRVSGDELMAEYNQKLPDKQRDLMPSLREWYAKLSEALHDAREDLGLFEAVLESISQHFEIRRVFKIPEV